MKNDSNNETDRLLRRYASRLKKSVLPGSDPSGAFQANNTRPQGLDFPHLDADELSAFAENALPLNARARYTAHLADCDSCRKLVSDLVMSSGVVSALNSTATPLDTQKRASWLDRLSAIFAPRILRYAASIILLVGIASIALLVLRERKNSNFSSSDSQSNNAPVASKSDSSTGETSKTMPSGNTSATSGSPELGTTNEGEKKPGLFGQENKENAGPDAQAQDAIRPQDQPKTEAAPITPNDKLDAKQAAGRDEDSNLAMRRQPAPAVTEVDKSKAKNEREADDETARVAQESRSREESKDNSASSGSNVAANKSAVAGRARADSGLRDKRGNAPPPKEPAESTTVDSTSEGAGVGGVAGEKKAVNGKQFVRRDGVWVDSAYRSQATTNLKRGSDQYRALVADEPGIRSIANQLGGDIIVVWKGRAYRIR